MFRIISEEHPKPEEHPKLERNDPLWSLMALCWAREPKMRPTISDVKVEVSTLGCNNDMSKINRTDLISAF